MRFDLGVAFVVHTSPALLSIGAIFLHLLCFARKYISTRAEDMQRYNSHSVKNQQSKIKTLGDEIIKKKKNEKNKSKASRQSKGNKAKTKTVPKPEKTLPNHPADCG